MKPFGSFNFSSPKTLPSTISGCVAVCLGLTLFGGFLKATFTHPVAFLLAASISAVSATLALRGE